MFISEALGVNEKKALTIGGADVSAIADEFGTPVYIMDEEYIRKQCRGFISALKENYGDNIQIAFASKAFSCVRIYQIMKEEGIGTDIVSGGELYTALRAGMPAQNMFYHGNNKTQQEIAYALDSGVGRFVVDNIYDLHMLNEEAKKRNMIQGVQFRIKPGIEAHTHEFTQTGQTDSKFGVSLEAGEAMDIIKTASLLSNINIMGIHCHIGSQIFGTEGFFEAARLMSQLMLDILEQTGIRLSEINLGGGYGIRYVEGDTPSNINENIKACVDGLNATFSGLDSSFKKPKLIIEPGRSIVGASGITVYRVGGVKEIPNIRNYVSVDGGMSDNPRYALYGAQYDALLVERPCAEKTKLYTIAGRSCESGDLISKDVLMPEIEVGEYLAVLNTGAYNFSMASNYNRIPRPPVVMIKQGKPSLAVRRETYEDIMRNDII